MESCWHRADRIGLAGFRTGKETENLSGGVVRVNCSLRTAKKYTDVGGNSLGKNWLRARERLPFKKFCVTPKLQIWCS